MATKNRVDFEGAVHHVFHRGNNKQELFRDDDDFTFFLERLARLKAELQFQLFAFCLMTNHFHLLIKTGQVPLSKVMERLLTAYAIRFNAKGATVGHVFQGPYGARICGNDRYFVRLLRYIHRNPVKAGIVASPEAWLWSGHASLAGGTAGLLDREVPLSYFSGDPQLYAKYVENHEDDLAFRADGTLTPEGATDEVLELAELLAGRSGFSADELLGPSRRHELTPVRRELVLMGLERGLTQRAMARAMGRRPTAITMLIARNK